MKLTVISDAGVVLKKTVAKVWLPSVSGPFEVMERHAPTVAQLTSGKIVYQIDTQKAEITIKSGFAEVDKEGAVVFAEV